MSGFLGIGGSSAKTDRSNTLTSFSQLKNIFNYAMPQAQSAISGGESLLSSAGNYFNNLLTGNRSNLQAAAAPETNAALSGADAARRQAGASGTARGGGTAATNANAKSDVMAQIDNALFGVRGKAAEGAAGVGSSIAGIGSNLLGTAAGVSSSLGNISSGARATDNSINRQGIGDVFSTIGSVLGSIF
jgi:hypothetical protein